MEQAEELQAIHDRHVHVNDEQIDFPLPQERETPRCVRGNEHVPLPFRVSSHEVPDHFQKARIVIDEQNRCVLRCHGRRQRAGDHVPKRALAPATFSSAILVEDSGFAKKKNQAA